MWRFVSDNLDVGYDGAALACGISFSIGPGECVLLCGANGIGKSTLLKTMAGLCSPLGGTCRFEPDNAGHHLVMVPPKIPKVPGFTVEEFIAAGCFRETGWFGHVPLKIRKRIGESVTRMGIQSLSGRDISSLSDGEFQKVTIASALAQRADIILLDEPTAFLDVDSRESVLSVLQNLVSQGNVSVVFSSHDIVSASRCCNRVFGMLRSESGIVFNDSGRRASADVIRETIEGCFTSFRGFSCS